MEVNSLHERLHALLGRLWPGLQGTAPTDAGDQGQPVYTLEDLPGWDSLTARGPALPAGYWASFSPTPLDSASEVFVQREDANAAIDNALARWRAQQPVSIALVGLDASGRTSFLNHLQQRLGDDLPITRIALNQRMRTPGQLIELISTHLGLDAEHENLDSLCRSMTQQPPRMILIDDAQYLLLRSLGNAAVIKRFLALLLATQNHCLWLVSMKEHAWHRLDYLYGFGRFFTDVIRLPYFSKEQFTAALQSRLHKAGVALHYPDVDDEEAPAHQDLDEATAQQLFTLSGGNLLAALFYWHWCTQYDPERGQLQLQPFRRINPDIATGLDRIYLFTLAELLVHGDLSVTDHAEIFHCETLESRLVLDYLLRRRFIDKRPDSLDRSQSLYGISPIFYLPIANALQAAHVMY